MDRTDLNRRDFTRLTLAAFGGAVTGAMAGCSDAPTPPPPALPSNTLATGGSNPAAGAENFQMGDTHVCRGLNACKNKGQSKDNACAGQGDCATFEASCGNTNDCKGLGGCKGTAGINACKGEGGCQVPLMAGAWTGAREAFESRMKAENKTFGEAPAEGGGGSAEGEGGTESEPETETDAEGATSETEEGAEAETP